MYNKKIIVFEYPEEFSTPESIRLNLPSYKQKEHIDKMVDEIFNKITSSFVEERKNGKALNLTCVKVPSGCKLYEININNYNEILMLEYPYYHWDLCCDNEKEKEVLDMIENAFNVIMSNGVLHCVKLPYGCSIKKIEVK
jgi:predicted secreted protein